jgi:hypothetical protein
MYVKKCINQQIIPSTEVVVAVVVAVVVSMEAFHTTLPGLQVMVPMVTPALQEVLPTVAAAAANVPGLAKMEIPTASSNMHLEAATTLEVA